MVLRACTGEDGESHFEDMEPGTILLAEDTSGKGRESRGPKRWW